MHHFYIKTVNIYLVIIYNLCYVNSVKSYEWLHIQLIFTADVNI